MTAPAPPPQTIEIVSEIASIAPADWDRLAHGERSCQPEATLRPEARLRPEAPLRDASAGPSAEAPPAAEDAAEVVPEAEEDQSQEDIANPFISHAFLSALEASGSVGGRTGWTPLHIVARDAGGRLIGAVPAYGKTHSRGEYVFDHAFAEAYTRAGGHYYPKLQVSVPFTPATARKLLIAPDAPARETRARLIAGLDAVRTRIDASSVHATFLTAEDREALITRGYALRTDQQFHFTNHDYGRFDDFLGALASRKRKVLKRERRDALLNGVSVEWVTGKDLTEAHWDAFFRFYMDTGNRKWGSPYLTRKFFSLVGERLAEKTLLIMAKRDGRYIAGALNFIGANTLYGRNWGAIEHHPFLHFELCYYQAIDFAITHRLARVEAGAQGEHKLARGYAPVKTYSAHRFADAGFARAVASFLDRERIAVDRMQAELETMTPFRRG